MPWHAWPAGRLTRCGDCRMTINSSGGRPRRVFRHRLPRTNPSTRARTYCAGCCAIWKRTTTMTTTRFDGFCLEGSRAASLEARRRLSIVRRGGGTPGGPVAAGAPSPATLGHGNSPIDFSSSVTAAPWPRARGRGEIVPEAADSPVAPTLPRLTLVSVFYRDEKVAPYRSLSLL